MDTEGHLYRGANNTSRRRKAVLPTGIDDAEHEHNLNTTLAILLLHSQVLYS
jgi:hypothetical protein